MKMNVNEQNPYSVIAEGLTKVFNGKVAVNELYLQVRKGEFFGFLGPNGAGKTTTIKMLVGLLRPTRGRVEIAGYDLAKQPLEVKRRIGVLPEELNLYERLGGREFLQFAGKMYGLAAVEANRRTEELLEVLDLKKDADKLIVDYSHGMKKKVALAAALIHNPSVLFLDEPFEGIDAITGHVIRRVLQQLSQRGTTIFFSSHILEVVERLCTQVAIIHEGRLVGQGSLAELRTKAQTPQGSSLEEIFLKLVGATEGEEGLSWLK